MIEGGLPSDSTSTDPEVRAGCQAPLPQVQDQGSEYDTEADARCDNGNHIAVVKLPRTASDRRLARQPLWSEIQGKAPVASFLYFNCRFADWDKRNPRQRNVSEQLSRMESKLDSLITKS